MDYHTTSYEVSDAVVLDHAMHADIQGRDSEMITELEDYDCQFSGEYYANDVLEFLRNNSV